MQFLKILFWVVIAVLLYAFANGNWHDVTINLWGDIQADAKLPVLLALMFLIGFLPPFLIMRARVWHLRRRVASHERERSLAAAEPLPRHPADDTPVE